MKQFLSLLDNQTRTKALRLIAEYNIGKPREFLKIKQTKITNMGNLSFLKIKCALAKIGIECGESVDEITEKINEIKAKSKKREALLRTRFLVLERDRFRCQYCGRSPKSNAEVQLHIDHIYPQSRGGKDTLENYITSCAECNLGKGDYILKQLIERNKN